MWRWLNPSSPQSFAKSFHIKREISRNKLNFEIFSTLLDKIMAFEKRQRIILNLNRIHIMYCSRTKINRVSYASSSFLRNINEAKLQAIISDSKGLNFTFKHSSTYYYYTSSFKPTISNKQNCQRVAIAPLIKLPILEEKEGKKKMKEILINANKYYTFFFSWPLYFSLF